jgi:succinate-semialdehyde dehydrogenase/glutarate-semialdehyde dehydrogenase
MQTCRDAAEAVDAAARAAKGWRDTAPRKRSEILRRCFELMMSRAEELAQRISLMSALRVGRASSQTRNAGR